MTYRAVKSLFPSMEFWLFHLQPKFTWITLNASFIHPKKQFISPVHYCATKYIRISERVENYCFYYGWINLRTSLPASHSSTVPCRWFSDSLPLHISTSCFFFLSSIAYPTVLHQIERKNSQEACAIRGNTRYPVWWMHAKAVKGIRTKMKIKSNFKLFIICGQR